VVERAAAAGGVRVGMEKERQFFDPIFLHFQTIANIGKSAESQSIITKNPTICAALTL
jgi:hypothetical protein